MFIYEVVCDIDNDSEVREYCFSNNIDCIKNGSIKNGKLCSFVGSKEKLEELHNNFFNEYEFEIREV